MIVILDVFFAEGRFALLKDTQSKRGIPHGPADQDHVPGGDGLLDSGRRVLRVGK